MKKKSSKVSAEPHGDVGVGSEVEVPAIDVPAARVSIAGASPLDQIGAGKEKLLEQVVTPNSRKKPPLPEHPKRKLPPDEAVKQTRRRQGSSLPCRSTRRLEAAKSSESVHIHVNLDSSNGQVQSRSASPKKITVIVSPRKLRRRARRSLEVTTPSALAPIPECSGSDEDGAQPQSSTQEAQDAVGEPSVVKDFLQPLIDSIGSPVFPMHKPQLLGVDALSSRPSSPGACNQFELSGGPAPYLVDIASSGDDRGPARDAIVPAVTPNATPPRASSPTVNIGNFTPPLGNQESPEEALDQIIATLPTPARLRWLSTRAYHACVI